MGWIKLDDNTFAEEATPDPRKILDVSEITILLEQKQRELEMYENELINITERKNSIQAEIDELNELLL